MLINNSMHDVNAIIKENKNVISDRKVVEYNFLTIKYPFLIRQTY